MDTAVGIAMTDPHWSVFQIELTAATVFPILLGSALILASLLVAVRSLRVSGRAAAGAVAVLGALGVAASLVGGLDRPGSPGAFAVGAVGASCCYAAVCPELFAGDSRRTARTVALLSVLWIAGFLTVGATAGVGSRHYVLGGVFGLLVAGVALVSSWWNDDRTGQQYGWLGLSAAFLCPATVGVIFGEELLFVTYLIAAVVGTVLWWFDRLRQGRY